MNNLTSKTVIINRAVPGSGKTTISKNIISSLQLAGLSVSKHSTDDYFMCGNQYCFNPHKLHEYHEANLDCFITDLKNNVDVVICDNTNLIPWETYPYTSNARKFGYKIIFINFFPRALEEHVKTQQVTPEKPDAHGVPEITLKKFICDFYNYNSLLDDNNMVDPSRHFDFIWDDELLCPVTSGITKGFEFDNVITIMPEEYHSKKNTIGIELQKLITKK
jgi:hypothetical protein